VALPVQAVCQPAVLRWQTSGSRLSRPAGKKRKSDAHRSTPQRARERSGVARAQTRTMGVLRPLCQGSVGVNRRLAQPPPHHPAISKRRLQAAISVGGSMGLKRNRSW
jgi:hypothetical protein